MARSNSGALRSSALGTRSSGFAFPSDQTCGRSGHTWRSRLPRCRMEAMRWLRVFTHGMGPPPVLNSGTCGSRIRSVPPLAAFRRTMRSSSVSKRSSVTGT